MWSGGKRGDVKTNNSVLLYFKEKSLLWVRRVLGGKPVFLPGLLLLHIRHDLSCTKFCYLGASFSRMGIKALAYKAYLMHGKCFGIFD